MTPFAAGDRGAVVASGSQQMGLSRPILPWRARWRRHEWMVPILTLAALAVFHFAFVASTDTYAGPYLDDFVVTDAVVGGDLWASLVRPHYGHCLILPKLLVIASARLTHGFGFARFFSVGLLTVATGCFLIAARRLRGRLALEDASLPFILMTPGAYFSTIHTFDLHYIVALALLGALCAIASDARRAPSVARTTIELVLIGGLLLCGVNGVLLGSCIAVGWFHRAISAGPQRICRASLATAGALGLIVLAITMIRWGAPRAPGVGWGALPDVTATTLQFLAVAWGPAVRSPQWIYVFAVLTLIVLASGAGTALSCLRVADGPSRTRVVALLLALTGHLLIAVTIGLGRRGWGHEVFAGAAGRYTLLSAPGLAIGFLLWIWSTAGDGRWLTQSRWARAASIVPVAIAVALMPSHLELREEFARAYRFRTSVLLVDLSRGLATEALVARHAPFLYPYDSAALTAWITQLRRSGFRPFDALATERKPTMAKRQMH